MKRSSRVNPKDPPKIRSYSLRGITGIRASDKRIGTATTLENEDMNRVKRVKFPDPEIDHLPSCRPDASSVQHEASQAPRSDAPKTSEYAFFKKLKKDACNHSYPLHKEENQLKDVELSDSTTEVSNKIKHRYKDVRSSLPVKKARLTNNDSFLSPFGDASKNSEITKMVGPRCKGMRSPLLIEKVAPINCSLLSPSFGDGTENSGNQFSDEGVFSTKRQKLRQWVADTSLCEVEELCSKGFDLVSVLLSRLSPENNENNCCRDPKSRQMEFDTKYQLPSFSKSDAYVKDLHWTHRRNLMESNHGSYWDDDCSRYGPDRPRDLVISESEIMGSDFPTICPKKTRLQYKHGKPPCDLAGTRLASLCTENDSSFRFERYGYIAAGHLKELDEFHEPNGSALRGEPCTLLLGWDFNNEKDEQDFSITSQNTEMNLFPTLAISWGNDLPQNLHNRLNASTLCSSSLFSNNSPTFTSLLHSHSSSFWTHYFGRNLEDENDRITELDRFPLTLSYAPKYLKLVEDCTTNNLFEGSSIFLSPQDQHPWFMNKSLSDKHHRGLESLNFPTALDIDLGWKCLSMTDSFAAHRSSTCNDFQLPKNEGLSSYLLENGNKGSCLYSSNRSTYFSEGTLDSHDWPVINFEICHDKEMGRPLLPDNSRWIRSQEEMYYDDGDEWKYI